jgi:Replication factor-A C terminal domain/Replication protein A OB domain
MSNLRNSRTIISPPRAGNNRFNPLARPVPQPNLLTSPFEHGFMSHIPRVSTYLSELGSGIQYVDVVVVVANPNRAVRSERGARALRRAVTVCDTTGKTEFVLWGELAAEFNMQIGDVIEIRNAKVDCFNDIYRLTTTPMTRYDITKRYHNIQTWWDEEQPLPTLKPACNITSLKDLFTSMNEQQSVSRLHFVIEVEINNMGENIFYPSCGSCFKRTYQVAADAGSGFFWRCDRCQNDTLESHSSYIIKVRVRDHTSDVEMVAFDNVGFDLFGMKASELMKIKVCPFSFMFVFLYFNHLKIQLTMKNLDNIF